MWVSFLLSAGNTKYPGLFKIYSKKSTACCMDCFENDMKELEHCTVSLFRNNNSNCKQHITARHKDDLWGKRFVADTEGVGTKNSASRTLLLQDGGGSTCGTVASVSGSVFSK